MSLSNDKRKGASGSEPAAIISFTGNQSTFTWETINATSVSINQGIGAVSLSGSIANPYKRDGNYKPAHSITWTLTAFGGGVTVTQSVTVYYESLYPWYCVHIPGHPNCQ